MEEIIHSKLEIRIAIVNINMDYDISYNSELCCKKNYLTL